MAGFRALGLSFSLDHLDLGISRPLRVFLSGVEAAVRSCGAEIARAKLPHEVAAVFAVIGGDAAFAGIVEEAAGLGAPVQRADGVGGERAVAHGRDVQKARGIGLHCRPAPTHDAECGMRFDGPFGAME